jgi:hypothetical protein
VPLPCSGLTAGVLRFHVTHEPLVTRTLFDAATPVARVRERSRTTPGINSHPAARRSYLLRSSGVSSGPR